MLFFKSNSRGSLLMNRTAAPKPFFSFASRSGEALIEKRFFRRFYPTNSICQTHPSRPPTAVRGEAVRRKVEEGAIGSVHSVKGDCLWGFTSLCNELAGCL
jgi:hypothetical protein